MDASFTVCLFVCFVILCVCTVTDFSAEDKAGLSVCVSVCLSVCQLVAFVSPAKTAEPIEMPFGA